ncbi:FAD dependent oxidoreductase [Purpureocillium lilacinum]|uniref:FAD dependent oxidoreductase n=1 Tax=Purpureocillium lilacinum TaxID=33203 RepID=A0A179H0T7_PURLI|nr:FAD dependent oxidoreductase [Purpureocillium lilacinum]
MTASSLQDGQAELPTPRSTHSYWHRDPSKKLLGHRTTTDLPPTADVVVIGSGITGAFAARELVAGGRCVLMLEAREACWGATGRNGGHCQPMIWTSSAEVARFELATFNLIDELVAQHDIPCDWRVVGGMHAIFAQDVLDAAQTQMKRLHKHEDLRDKAVLILDKKELAAQRIPEALGAVYQPKAAKCWPYKLVAWLLERLLDENAPPAFNLQTKTPVEHLQKSGSSWIVHTQRGQVCAKEVLLASNAYTSYLLPEMTGLILPVRGQVCALEPPPGAAQLAHSYVWLEGSDAYLIHRGPEDTQVRGDEQAGVHSRPVDRSLVVGGQRLAAPGWEEGISRDDAVNPILSKALHGSLAHTVKLLPGDKEDPAKLRAAYEWTGIMGYSRDSAPWVGRVSASLVSGSSSNSSRSSSSVVDGESEAQGLWISAGYTGHGMPVAARCGVAVAEMMLGKEGGVKVPRGWAPSAERAEKARGMEQPRTKADMLRMLPAEFE